MINYKNSTNLNQQCHWQVMNIIGTPKPSVVTESNTELTYLNASL